MSIKNLDSIAKKYMDNVIEELSPEGFILQKDLIYFAEYLISFGEFLIKYSNEVEPYEKPEVKH